MLGDLFVFFADNYISRHDEGLVGAAVHDPLAVLALTHPDLFDGGRATSGSRRVGSSRAE